MSLLKSDPVDALRAAGVKVYSIDDFQDGTALAEELQARSEVKIRGFVFAREVVAGNPAPLPLPKPQP